MKHPKCIRTMVEIFIRWLLDLMLTPLRRAAPFGTALLFSDCFLQLQPDT